MFNQPQTLVLKSQRKWFWVALLLALFNPPLIGFIIALALWREGGHRREAMIIVTVAVLWAFTSYVAIRWFIAQGYLPRFQVTP
mgnify:CR=1 FL=1